MTTTLASTFWDRLVEASQDVDLPYRLSDIGRELDIYPSAVARWESGQGLPYDKNLITLAVNRGVVVEWLKTGRGPKHAESAMDTGTRELIKIWQHLPPAAQERLLHAARYEQTINPSTPPHAPPPPDRDKPRTTPRKHR